MQPAALARYFRTLTTLFGAMLAGQVLLLVVSVYLVATDSAPIVPDLHRQLYWLVPVMVLLVATIATLLAAKRYEKARRLSLLPLKLQGYQMAIVVVVAMLNAAGTFALIAFLVTGESYYLVVFAAVLFLFFRQRPSPAHARNALALSDQELPNL